jgi:hypothetical protein
MEETWRCNHAYMYYRYFCVGYQADIIHRESFKHLGNYTVASKHHHAHTTSLTGIYIILRINASRNGRGPVVVQIVVKLPIAKTKFLLFKEQRVVQ